MTKPRIFDVSGVDGASGTSSKRHHSTASHGVRGLGDSHGTDGQCGTSAGTIELRLTTPKTTANIPKNVVLANPIDVDVKLDGTIVYSDGRLQKMDTILKVNLGKTMRFRALGGHGGNGGDGGYGQHGGKGLRYGAFLTFFNIHF
jgi:hypothetical protein